MRGNDTTGFEQLGIDIGLVFKHIEHTHIRACNNIITTDAEGTEEWKELAEPIYAEWIADMESKGIDGQALIDEARAKIDEYSQ